MLKENDWEKFQSFLLYGLENAKKDEKAALFRLPSARKLRFGHERYSEKSLTRRENVLYYFNTKYRKEVRAVQTKGTKNL